MNIKDDIGKAIDTTNAQIDKLLNVETTSDYNRYLQAPKTNSYFIRPCGTVEFIAESN